MSAPSKLLSVLIEDAIRKFYVATGKEPSYLYLGYKQRDELSCFIDKYGCYPGGEVAVFGKKPKVMGLTMFCIDDPDHLRVS